MKIVQPSFQILGYTPDMTKLIERGIRTAYKSEDKIQEGSDVEIISRIKNYKHESTLEHGSITVHFVTDRGVTHELVRHRLSSFTQESTRYCNYGKGKFGNEITVVEPFFYTLKGNGLDTLEKMSANIALVNKCEKNYKLWEELCLSSEKTYLAMLEAGAKPQEARSVLPNSLKTEIVVTANAREWRHIMNLRTARDAHPQIRQIMCPLLVRFREMWPILFDDVGNTEHDAPATEVKGSE